MGYYTDYTLTCSYYSSDEDSFTKANKIPAIIVNSLREEIDKMDIFESGDIDEEYSELYGNAKWYDYDKDMTILSKKYPEILFCLHGEGEDREDMWDAYYLNGMSQFCPSLITYDKFDPKLLKMGKHFDVAITEGYEYQK